MYTFIKSILKELELIKYHIAINILLNNIMIYDLKKAFLLIKCFYFTDIKGNIYL